MRSIIAICLASITLLVVTAGLASAHHEVKLTQNQTAKLYPKLYSVAEKNGHQVGRNVLKHGRAKDGKLSWSLLRKETTRLLDLLRPEAVAEHERERIRNGFPQYVWDHLATIARCESGSSPTTNTGNGYYGKYQFALGTWYAVGGSGLPSSATEAEQDYRAALLYVRSGPGQWPVCQYR